MVAQVKRKPPTLTPVPPQDDRAYIELKRAARAAMTGKLTMAVSDLLATLKGQFVGNTDFMAQLAEEMADSIFSRAISEVMSETRRLPDGPGLILLGDVIVPSPRAPRKAKGSWGDWIERVADRQRLRHTRLLVMTKEELKTALAERMARAERDLRICRLWQKIIDGLPDGGIVGSTFDADRIDGLWQEVVGPDDLVDISKHLSV